MIIREKLPQLEELAEMSEVQLKLTKSKAATAIMEIKAQLARVAREKFITGNDADHDWFERANGALCYAKRLQFEVDKFLFLFAEKRKEHHRQNEKDLLGKLAEILDCRVDENIIIQEVRRLKGNSI